tara:strand:- start:14087 stop:15100 length:1014 start_codon:yes stop_codon:yes gene_type:complete
MDKIYVLCTLEHGLSIVDSIKDSVPIAGIIGLSNRDSTDQVSGYKFVKSYCDKNSFEFIEVETYNLSSDKDKSKILSYEIDIILVCGWQRLVPNWLINHVKCNVIGAHGSPYGINGGRGRSPLNWALILGKLDFHLSIFSIDSGVDSGKIIGTSGFEISELDNITTCRKKANAEISRLIIKNFSSRKIFGKDFKSQEGEVKYLPQRIPKDGQIDWNLNSSQLYNFIRAQSKPFPGAFTTHNGKIVKIWTSKKIKTNVSKDYNNGEIIKIVNDKSFHVKCYDGVILVDNFSNDDKIMLEEGMIFESSNFKEQMGTIIERHYSKYPLFELCEDIHNLAN